MNRALKGLKGLMFDLPFKPLGGDYFWKQKETCNKNHEHGKDPDTKPLDPFKYSAGQGEGPGRPGAGFVRFLAFRDRCIVFQDIKLLRNFIKRGLAAINMEGLFLKEPI